MNMENNVPINSEKRDSTIQVSPEQRRQLMVAANKKAAWFWCSGVVLLLGLQLALGASAIYLSKSDPSVAVVPEYYRRALDFDETKLAIANSQKLNWLVSFTANINKGFTVAVVDENQLPVALKTASVRYYHLANASQPFAYFLEDQDSLSDGKIVIPEPLQFAGRWHIEIDLLSVTGERFVQHRQITIESKQAYSDTDELTSMGNSIFN